MGEFVPILEFGLEMVDGWCCIADTAADMLGAEYDDDGRWRLT